MVLTAQLLMGLALLVMVDHSCSGVAVRSVSKGSDGEADSEFSLREFYSIKNAVLKSKTAGGRAGAALESARARAISLSSSVPQSARFYGQDHYEARRDSSGVERWMHVGRPDELAYQLFFRAPLKTNGTFIESGAGDGVKASNTLFFEEQLGWSGLLVEGSADNFVKLVRDGRRKRATKTFAAVCEETGTAKFVGDGLAAGALEDMTRHHVESWGRHFRNLEVYDVPCERMEALVRRAGLGRVVDLWSIDVEGGEWRALNSFDWDAYEVRVVVIEMGRSCFGGGGGRNRCETLLRRRGFCRVARKAVNEFWTADEGFKKAYCAD